MDIRVKESSLVVLCGVAGSGKSTFAENNFRATEIVSSDRCRAIISDDEGNIEVSKDAFELFHFIIQKRVKAGKLVVADSTALTYEARKRLLRIAHDNNYYVILMAFDVPLEKAIERNSMRDRQVPEKVIENQYYALKKTLRSISKEGFDEVIILGEDDMKSSNCTIIHHDTQILDKNTFKNISAVLGYNQLLKFDSTNLQEFVKPLYFKSRDGYEAKLSKDEVEETVKLLSSCPEILPWTIYIPTLAPVLSSGDLMNQVQYSLKYYADRGIHKCIVEVREQSETCIVIICKDKDCSVKYFSGNSFGQIYSLNTKPQIEEQERNRIVNILWEDFKRSGYFEYHNTDFIIFEASVYDRGENYNIVPLKIIANSRRIFLDRDNLWQVENTGKFKNMSEIIKRNVVLILDSKEYKSTEIDGFLSGREYQNIVVKPVKVLRHNGHLIQPEILCSTNNYFYRDEYIKLSLTAYELAYSAVEMFTKNKFSKKYFEFLIGCVTINNRMSRMRM